MKKLIKFSFEFMAIFWLLSPLVFAGMRMRGIFDFRHDWAVGIFLAAMSTATMYFTFRTWEE